MSKRTPASRYSDKQGSNEIGNSSYDVIAWSLTENAIAWVKGSTDRGIEALKCSKVKLMLDVEVTSISSCIFYHFHVCIFRSVCYFPYFYCFCWLVLVKRGIQRQLRSKSCNNGRKNSRKVTNQLIYLVEIHYFLILAMPLNHC